ncbi:hypothetical protein ACFL6C_04810 [Myxococcota bacterium]
MKIIQSMLLVGALVAAAAMVVACEDQTKPEPTKSDIAAPAPDGLDANKLKDQFAKEAKEAITADNAEAVAAQLEKEIDSDSTE